MTRKVTIINSRTQSQHVIDQSTATNLGELKTELRNAGISYEGMTFFEGHLRAELKDDASVLPESIPYKGQVVTDLVFMLTSPEKKIKSGAMTRTEVYDAIKRRGLQNQCLATYGKNFTMCKTSDLVALLEEVATPTPVKEKATKAAKKAEAKAETKETVETTTEATPEVSDKRLDSVIEILLEVMEELEIECVIESSLVSKAKKLFGTNVTIEPEEEEGLLSKGEIEDMFDFL